MIVDRHPDVAPLARRLVLNGHHPFLDDDRIARSAASARRSEPRQRQIRTGRSRQPPSIHRDYDIPMVRLRATAGGRSFASAPADVLAVRRGRQSSSSGSSSSFCSPRESTTASAGALPCTTPASSTRSSRPVRRRCTTATASTSSPTAPQFYPAMIEAIRGATQLDQHGVATSSSPDGSPTSSSPRSSDRARHGVNVTIVVDAIGSFSLLGRPVRRLRKAGCRIESYQSLRWHSLARLNNRTHRELLIVDGRLAFAGGAGIADWWNYPRRKGKPLARHDGADRGPHRRRVARRGGGELARMLRRDPDRP